MSGTYSVNLRLLAAFRHLMVPLVRILVRSGIQFRDFVDVLRGVYARVAVDELSTPSRPMSVARLAIVTGLTRREIARVFSEEDYLRKALESNANALACLLQGWHNDPEFMGPYGFPRDLAFSGESTSALTFSDLVQRYASGRAPALMLDELIRVNAATHVVETGLIRVLERTFIPEEMAPELIEVFARGVRRYVETIDHNIRARDQDGKRFERWVFPDYGISEDEWDKYRQLVHDRLQQVIEDLDTRFAAFDRPRASEAKVLSVGVGMYVYKDEADDERLFALDLNSLASGAAREQEPGENQ